MYAVGVDCCFFLMMIGLSGVCDDDSQSQPKWFVVIPCMSWLFSKDSRVKYHELTTSKIAFIYIFFPFLRYSTLPIPSMYGVYVYIYIDKHGWYGLRWCLSRLQVYVGEKTHQWQRQIKVFFRDSLLKTSQFWLYWVGGWSQGRCFCLKIFQRYLHIRVSFCLRNTVFIFNVFFFTPPNVKSMRPWKDVAQSPFFGRIFW